MAKAIMFMRNELYSGSKESNEKFRKMVREFAYYILDDKITLKEYCQTHFESALNENPDCRIVFTIENTPEAQAEACLRGILTFEYLYYSSNKIVPIYTEKDNSNGITSYTKKYYPNLFGIVPFNDK